jgi:hypothetical protein
MIHRFRQPSRALGSAYIVILMITLVLGIFVGAVMTFMRGQVHLLSRSAKDYLALNAAEAGLNCVLAEMRANPQFVTHGNSFIPLNNWSSPTKHRPFLLQETEGLELDHAPRGTYSGRIVMKKSRVVADFKVRVRLIGAKNSLNTKTVEESHRYFLIEAIGHIDGHARKISGVLEKYHPGAYLLYDGSVLDTGGYGPYPGISNIFRRGRIYGQDLIRISKRGILDAGSDFKDMEKLSTPGHIKVTQNSTISFRNGQEGKLKGDTDSDNLDQFQSFPEKSGKDIIGHFVLDGMHGGKSERFPPLNAKYYRDATDPKPTILSPGCGFDGFSESKWRNPAKPDEVVYDLDFGWEYKKRDDKVLLFSTVPLRIWGCPPNKATTIFCEKDVYIAGDFNANPDTTQNYDFSWRDYTETPENGTDKNGVVIMSLGRIWFDYSQPILFLRNELRTLLDYEIGLRLGGRELSLPVIASIVFPHRFSTGSDPRLPMTALHFTSISSLFALPKETPAIIALTLATIALAPDLKEIREFFQPSANVAEYRNRFSIKSDMTRTAIYEKIGAFCYMTGLLTKGERNGIIEGILKQAQKEALEEDPDPTLGPWNVTDRLFKLAISHPKMGFRMPEMTVNAVLIDSAELNARWDTGDGGGKVLNEIGNIAHASTRSFPYVFASETRVLLRHLGTTMHLRNRPCELFLDGKLRNDSFLVRRKVWDSTFVSGGGDYHPRYMPAAFGRVSWNDEVATLNEFKSF